MKILLSIIGISAGLIGLAWLINWLDAVQAEMDLRDCWEIRSLQSPHDSRPPTTPGTRPGLS